MGSEHRIYKLAVRVKDTESSSHTVGLEHGMDAVYEALERLLSSPSHTVGLELISGIRGEFGVWRVAIPRSGLRS